MSVRQWGPPMLWAAFILLLTSIPGAAIPHVGIRFTDKLVHTTMYGIFAWLATRALLRTGRPVSHTLLVVVGIVLFAALDEWHQQFIPGRSMELLDWVADSSGATVGALAAALAERAGGGRQA